MKQKKTLLQAIENLVVLSSDSELSDDFWKKARTDAKYLAKRMGITECQAVFFSICLEKGPRNVDLDDIARHLDLRTIRIMQYSDDIDALIRRRFLRYRDAKEKESFDIPPIVIKGLKSDEVYELPERKNLNIFDFFEELDHQFSDLNDDAITPNELYTELRQLFDNNLQLDFVKKVRSFHFCSEDELLFLLFCHLCVNEDDNDIRFNQMEDIFKDKRRFQLNRMLLQRGEHKLMQVKLIEHHCENGIAEVTRYKLTDAAKHDVLSELNIQTTEANISGVLKHGDLTAKELFYTDGNERQVKELGSFLGPKKYNEIHKRMEENGFRTGFACLFYGSPGTGKTETVYQLAKQTGRDIMIVDVPRIKSKWVGDSEKNIKALFDRYRELVGRAKVAPILLFNEADAIFGIRKNGAESAVDKMENSIQNIILQEMEMLDGILIATTNLTENLDTAFERRFLYKIRFEKPDARIRQSIWQTMMPKLSTSDAQVLAKKYDFSGGQIENISRKAAISAVLYGEQSINLELLEGYCKEERVENQGSKRKIGF